MLLFAVSLVLLIACTNIAALSLARTAERRSEFAVRTALGAAPGRLMLQQLTEFLGIALSSGILGILIAEGILQLLYSLRPAALQEFPRPELDSAVFAFTAIASLVAGLVFGVAPAWVAGRTHPIHALKAGATTHSRGVARFRKVLVAGEIAVAFVLLAGAGLLMRTMTNLNKVPLGYDVKGILSFSVSLHGAPYYTADETRTPALSAFYTTVLDRLAVLPGVDIVGAVSVPPLDRRADMLLAVSSEMTKQSKLPAAPRFASSGYFSTMGIPIVAGRDFSKSDTEDSRKVVIITRDLADKLWPEQNPIGKTLYCAWSCKASPAVVGVIQPHHNYGPRNQTLAEYYLPYTQQDWPYMTFVLRTRINPAALAPAVRKLVASIDASQPIYDVQTMQERLEDTESLIRFELFALSAFAGFSVLLVLIGLYGVVSYTVTQRTREIGIRIALGSRRGPILRSVIWESARIVLVGAAIGFCTSLIFLRLLKTVLFGVTAHDPGALGGAMLCFLAAAFVAAYLPARRAADVDPIAALRAD